MKSPSETLDTMQIDIVSDVMCPWCVIGYKQLEQALTATGLKVDLRWHPFELNPGMPQDGQNLAEHIAEKYGSTPAQSEETRARIQHLGADLGFEFNFSDRSKVVNTFRAHQLLDWAETQSKQHALKLALFAAHFTDELDVSDDGVLVQVARSVGLNASDATDVLSSGAYAQSVRDKQKFWTSRGISGVPSVIFSGKYLLTGAQGAETYADVLRKVQDETAAA
ncbi:DsbA family oxidoreductase [uncultured Roseobacter sp.]|uniref:DsbA family oxidoreductase n=1 Tax=uncultured Roseobacter sp. TaxID=114847 RepID=UPI00262DC681|nr:DsbA family oxidoreductase [uncultured Roseobacter sp.]